MHAAALAPRGVHRHVDTLRDQTTRVFLFLQHRKSLSIVLFDGSANNIYATTSILALSLRNGAQRAASLWNVPFIPQVLTAGGRKLIQIAGSIKGIRGLLRSRLEGVLGKIDRIWRIAHVSTTSI